MNLKTAREQKGLSMKQLGDAVGVSAASICRYENGERRPRLNVAKKIEKILGIPWYVIVDNQATEGR